MLITFLRKPNGQIDEQVGFSKNIREVDMQTCNIIVDYKERKVIKCVIERQVRPTDFDTMNDYYKKIYPQLVEQLEKVQAAERLDKNR
jgi:non-homologous end joining protein Ku